MESLVLESSIANNLGLSGYLQLNVDDSAFPPGSTPAGPPAVSAGKTLGRINLAGTSQVRIGGDYIRSFSDANLPFILWSRLILEAGQNIDIRRNPAAASAPLQIMLGLSVKTRIFEDL
jgi:hypothetical protein